MYAIYTLLLIFGFLAALPYFLWKGRRTGKYLGTFRERMGALPVYLNVDRERSIWLHAVSVGEVLAARPLVEALRLRFPHLKLFVSTTTETGNEIARRSLHGIDGLFYAPLDFPSPVRKALDTLRPHLLLLVETEIWPNLVHAAHMRGTRVAMVNGRISPRSFGRYLALRFFIRRVLGEVDLFLAQGEPHAERLRALGAPTERVRVSGNLKFDAAETPKPNERLLRLFGAEALGDRPLFIAGSTVEGEEELVLAALHAVRQSRPDVVLLLAPRHPQRFDGVAAAVEHAGFRPVRRSSLEPGQIRDGDVVLLDTMGELRSLYALARLAFVGGSLVPLGGHNIIEPAAAGIPVLVGPHMENFREIADQFRQAAALVEVRDAAELGREVASLLGDETRRRTLGARAKAILDQNRGAVALTVDALSGLLGR